MAKMMARPPQFRWDHLSILVQQYRYSLCQINSETCKLVGRVSCQVKGHTAGSEVI